MKAIIRIPTNDQFAFIEFEKDVAGVDDALDIYNEAIGRFRPNNGGIGLEHKDWIRVLDKYLTSKTLLSEENEKMSKAQQWMIKELDKAFTRLDPQIEPRVR